MPHLPPNPRFTLKISLSCLNCGNEFAVTVRPFEPVGPFEMAAQPDRLTGVHYCVAGGGYHATAVGSATVELEVP